LKVASDFIQASHNMPGQSERAAAVAFLLSTAGLLTKTNDITTNATMGH
jgi:hypothetical protein